MRETAIQRRRAEYMAGQRLLKMTKYELHEHARQGPEQAAEAEAELERRRQKRAARATADPH